MSAPRIPRNHPVQPLGPGEVAIQRASCGTCGRSWDDGKVTSMTPTPAARCPFEDYHASPQARGGGGVGPGTDDAAGWRPRITWRRPLTELDDTPGHFMGTVQIGTGDYFIEAIEVQLEEASGFQLAVNEDDNADRVEQIQAIVGGAGMTIERDGKSYLVCITPYGE